MRHLLCLLIVLLAVEVVSQETDLNVLLMQSTFFVVGPSKDHPGGTESGTAFLLVRPFDKKEGGRWVLVTAAHIFNAWDGDTAKILLRTKSNGGDWQPVVALMKIRDNKGQALWQTLPRSDVAVMYVSWPGAAQPKTPLSASLLADDDMLTKDGVVPGVELKILGYPLGNMGNAAGFPILRTGVIASYPLLPTSTTRTFFVDFRVFKGNSGGPVYFAQPVVKGSSYVCCPPQFIAGVVSEETVLEGPYAETQLSLAKVVHASLIKAALELLPAPDTPEADKNVSVVEIPKADDAPKSVK
jgi:hypothetical protein